VSQPADADRLAHLLGQTAWVLLDFDGPVCSVFAGYPAPAIAAELRDWIASEAIQLPRVSDDPHDVLRQAAEVSGQLARQVETRLRTAEIRAATTAEPTPGAAEFLTVCQATGRPVAIVSNNTADAITTYLDRADLAHLVAHVEGRDRHDTALMKPHPHSLRLAMQAIGASPSKSALIGDSTSDMHAATAAGVIPIGYANKPGKRDRLSAAGAAAITAAMYELTAALTDHDALPN
jgi:HAD superfamily hydrolase (TIGR01509 family)